MAVRLPGVRDFLRDPIRVARALSPYHDYRMGSFDFPSKLVTDYLVGTRVISCDVHANPTEFQIARELVCKLPDLSKSLSVSEKRSGVCRWRCRHRLYRSDHRGVILFLDRLRGTVRGTGAG